MTAEEEIQMHENNFQHLKHVCEVQVRVRNCEIEGSVMPIETKIEHSHDLGLINLAQESELQEILKGT